MNQSLIFAFIVNQLNWRRTIQPGWALLSMAWLASSALAQIEAPYAAPQSAGTGAHATIWPAQKYTVDSQLRPANYESEPVHRPMDATAQAGGSIESWIDAAGPAISGFKETVVNQTQGLMGMVTGKSGKGSSPNVAKMLSSLALVLGGYFAFVWVTRKLSPASNSRLPADVVDVLGRTPFGPKQTLQLVRLGSKLLLLLEGPDGTHPIGEITDPLEVQQLTSTCRPGKSFSFGRLPRSSTRGMSTSPHNAANSAATIGNSATSIPLMTNESVHQSLANVLRTLENATRQPFRGNSFEA